MTYEADLLHDTYHSSLADSAELSKVLLCLNGLMAVLLPWRLVEVFHEPLFTPRILFVSACLVTGLVLVIAANVCVLIIRSMELKDAPQSRGGTPAYGSMVLATVITRWLAVFVFIVGSMSGLLGFFAVSG